MTDSQTIPDKFLRAAREAYHSAFNEHGEARDIDLYNAIAKAIHDAVMAERKRCDVAVAMACHVGKYTPLSEYIAAIRATPKAEGK